MSGSKRVRRSTRISDAAEHGAGAKKWGGPVTTTSHSTQWSEHETKSFYVAFHRYGPSWVKVARSLGQSKTPEQCELLYKQHQGYLGLDRKYQNEVAFMTMVRDYNNLHKETDKTKEDSDTISDDGGIGNGSIVSAEDSAHRPGSMRTRRTPRQSAKAKAAAESTPPRSNKVLGRTVGSGGAQRRVRGLAEQELGKASPLESPMSKRKRAKRLQFGEEAETTRYAGAVQYLRHKASNSVFPTEPDHHGAGSDNRPNVWRKLEEANNEDEEKGCVADALLSLAMVHPSSSGVTEFDQPEVTEGYDINLGTLHGPQLQSLQQSQQYWTGLQPDSFVVLQPYAHTRDPNPSRYTSNPMYQRQLTATVAPDAFVRQQSVQEHSYDQGTAGLKLSEELIYTQGGEAFRNTAGTQGDSSHLQDSTATATSKQKSSEPAPRQRRRKPIPEKLPPMVSPIKSLFLRRASFNNISNANSQLMSLGMGGMHYDHEGLIMQHPAELRLRHVLSPKVRRWCMYEFMYSALDRPWFMQNELQDFLNYLGLGSITMLTRVEWSLVRGALGKPRRLSLRFLKEERAKLEKWREELRAQYEDIGRGNIDGIPLFLPRPLSVGQKVTARHPITRQIHDGQVLTVEHNSYRVQFDRRELGVEMVKDIDVMPVNPLDTLPPQMLQSQGALLVLNGHSFNNSQRPQRGRGRVYGQSRGPMAYPMQQVRQMAHPEDAQREALAAQLAAVQGQLEKKEALLVQMRNMNDEVEAGVTDPTLQQNLPFKSGYAKVVITLNKLNQELDASVVDLGDLAAQPTPGAASLALPVGVSGHNDQQQLSLVPHAVAAAEGDACQPTGSLPLSTTAWLDAQGVLECIQQQLSLDDPVKVDPFSTEAADANQTCPMPLDPSTGQGSPGSPDKRQWVSQLITGCVSMFLTLQQCSDSEMSSDAVRQALDSALLYVRPHADSNQGLYAQIQESIDHLKAQLL